MTAMVRALRLWPWLVGLVLKLWLVVLSASLLGVLTFAAVSQINLNCKREQLPILKLEYGISCRVAIDDWFAITLP